MQARREMLLSLGIMVSASLPSSTHLLDMLFLGQKALLLVLAISIPSGESFCLDSSFPNTSDSWFSMPMGLSMG